MSMVTYTWCIYDYIYMVYICIYRYSNPPKKMESYLISILIGIYCSIFFLWFLFAIYKVISVYRVYIYTIRYVGNIYMYKYMYRYVYIYLQMELYEYVFLFLWKKHGILPICQSMIPKKDLTHELMYMIDMSW